jgi:hypothetical protein
MSGREDSAEADQRRSDLPLPVLPQKPPLSKILFNAENPPPLPPIKINDTRNSKKTFYPEQAQILIRRVSEEHFLFKRLKNHLRPG